MQFSQLDTPSGHIVCGFILLIIGAVFYKMGIPSSTEIMTSGATILTMAMRGLNGKSVIPTAGPDTKTTVNTTSTSTSSTDPVKKL